MATTALPAITEGTDKQIAWATDIRARMLAEFAADPHWKWAAEYPTETAAAVAELAANTEARHWIDNYRYEDSAKDFGLAVRAGVKAIVKAAAK